MAMRFCTSELRGRLTPLAWSRCTGVLLELATMPRAIPPTVRQAVLRGHQRGLDPTALAQRFRLPLRTVYHLLRLGRDHGGGVPPPAYQGPPTGPHAAEALVVQARALRQEHPQWGAELIRVIL